MLYVAVWWFTLIIPLMESANKTQMKNPNILDSHQSAMVALFPKIKTWLLAWQWQQTRQTERKQFLIGLTGPAPNPQHFSSFLLSSFKVFHASNLGNIKRTAEAGHTWYHSRRWRDMFAGAMHLLKRREVGREASNEGCVPITVSTQNPMESNSARIPFILLGFIYFQMLKVTAAHNVGTVITSLGYTGHCSLDHCERNFYWGKKKKSSSLKSGWKDTSV